MARASKTTTKREPRPLTSVELTLEQDVLDYFQSLSEDHIALMQHVLTAYVTVHKSR